MEVQLNLFNEPRLICLQCGATITSRAELLQPCEKPAVAGGAHTILYHQHAALYRREIGFRE